MGLTYFTDWMESGNALRLELYEASYAALAYHRANTMPFSRLFAVRRRIGGPEARIGNLHTGKVMTMAPDHLYLLNSRLPIQFHFEPETEFFAFHFNLTLRGNYDLFLTTDVFAEYEDAGFVRAMSRIFFDEPFGVAGACRMKALLLDAIARFIPADVPDFQGTQYFYYGKLLSYIQFEADASTSMQTLSALTPFSADTLSRRFSADFGVPLKSYLNQTLAMRACLLIGEHRYRIREIARMLGFHNEYYFSRFFRKLTGMTPTQYRNQAGQSQAGSFLRNSRP